MIKKSIKKRVLKLLKHISMFSNLNGSEGGDRTHDPTGMNRVL